MTAEEFANLRPDDLVECAGVERRVLQNRGHVVSLTDKEGVLKVRREHADRICLLGHGGADARSAWDAVAAHLSLVNLVRARIGQRPLDRHSGYTPADIKADAEFYAMTQSWARQRARELGVGD
ncbi:hypothetical protein ENSA5_55820 [Enhygromyxa salina]|uniref:Uncharacterized protein n=1 Tax=Enhygromyxa salina TaxID=215803 RepID=A0A2S9XFC0_9BACT|nr:hypothetical protein [Enhygromyxa salina]PRP91371.1 hypothetical protein ENSA5_55820 [Enhygromyxa salina]